MKLTALRDRDAHETPRIAIVVPIFKHSALVVDAIESALAQELAYGARIVLVNDGCPHVETVQVCAEYALAYPGLVVHLPKANGGLSDARNAGIRFALERWPGVEAIYLLDADNKLRRRSLLRAMASLTERSGADWIYPNIDMFGNAAAWDYGGDYSLLVHTSMNVSEAGSLIHRRVFDAGVWFDTEFKLGHEDWDFFLCAAEAGFRGRNLDTFGFRYRKRPESMLANSARDVAVINGAMRQKHKALFQPRSLVALEQAECPRFALVIADRNEVILTVDPADSGAERIGIDAFVERYWRAKASPSRYGIPAYLVVTSSSVVEGLEDAKMLHWALWSLETQVRATGISLLTFAEGVEDRVSFSIDTEPYGKQTRASMVMMGPRLAWEVMKDSASDWIDSLTSRNCAPRLVSVDLALPRSRAPRLFRQGGTAAFDLLSLVHRLRASESLRLVESSWDWRQNGIEMRARAHEIVAREFRGEAAYPRSPGTKPSMGFVLPIVEFGGVEKVALNMARAMKERGWSTHLFVVQTRNAALTADWHAAFDSVNFLVDDRFATWGEARTSYFGTDVPNWATDGDHGRALGLMYWLDAVVNLHAGAITGVMGELKRWGVKTALSLHLSDLSVTGRPVGNTYLGLAYEHAYDVIAPCSHQLADWCHAMAVPQEKIVPVPNAAGFPADPVALAAGQAERQMRDGSEPLRVLFLGRLDRQKGIDRLSAVMRESRIRRLPVQWRVVGKSVIEDEASALSPEVAAALEPPAYTPAELSKLFAWADVLVLLSSFEGLPLTILEAMRAGVVPIATDVGAVSEVVVDGESGVLLPLDEPVAGCTSALAKLAGDRAALRGMSERAFESMVTRTWSAATADLSQALSRGRRPQASARSSAAGSGGPTPSGRHAMGMPATPAVQRRGLSRQHERIA
jgi:glycosyltransferase involved in cell wall biosynthesis